MYKRSIVAAVLTCLSAVGCVGGRVDMTKTAKGALAPANPNEVEVLMTRPERKYQELGTFTATGYPAMESAKMHNALRNKAAPLGANAVIITDSGQIRGEFGVQQLWVNGVAVR